jgi:hypothetical protein
VTPAGNADADIGSTRRSGLFSPTTSTHHLVDPNFNFSTRIAREPAMKNYREADKGRAMCENDGLVTTTFAFRDVPFRDGSGTVNGILVAVCDKCGEVVAVPPQAMPAIKAVREKSAFQVDANLRSI